MSATLTANVPAVFQSTVGGNSSVRLTGDTLGEAIGSVKDEYPDFVQALIQPDGTIQPYAHLFLQGAPVQDLDTTVVEGAELTIVSAVAGG